MTVYMAGRVPMGRKMLEEVFGDVGVEPEELKSCVPLGEELVGRLALLYGAGLLAAFWPRNVIRTMDTFRPTLWRGAVLTVLTLWSVLSFTGITTFIYSNF